MDCPECGAPTVAFDVPAPLQQHAPDGSAHAAICHRCLATVPAETGGGDLQTVSEAFPADHEAAVASALAIGKLDALALNRDAIRELFEHAERAGADPLLLLDRLDAQGSVQAHFDVHRRSDQVTQLLFEG